MNELRINPANPFNPINPGSDNPTNHINPLNPGSDIFHTFIEMFTRLIMLLITCCCISCSSLNKMSAPLNASQTNILDSLLKTSQALQSVLLNKDSFKLQVIYTKIDRDKNNKPHFTDYTFNENAGKYFYPASTVKLPASLLALEKLNVMKMEEINMYTTMITDSNYNRQEIVLNSSKSKDGRPTIAEYIKEIFLVSDNDAFNRLYEFLGQEYFNLMLHKRGYKTADIRHRLSTFLTEDQNRHTNAVSFYDTAGKLLYHQPPQFNKKAFTKRDNKAGKGFYRDSVLINEPFDFSAKNKISLYDLHNLLRAVIFPEFVPRKQRFKLTGEDYNFLYKYMSARPRESKYPFYDSTEYSDAYGKFLLFGAEKGTMPENIRIFNKIGDAYGFLNDVAYIVDFKNNIECMLSATMLCNTDGIFNDDKYDYDSIGFPFMKNLGLLIYNYEKLRQRKYVPDLSKFKIDYKE